MAAILPPMYQNVAAAAENFISFQQQNSCGICLPEFHGRVLPNNQAEEEQKRNMKMKMLLPEPDQMPPPTQQSPYYLCTVTCCESERCFEVTPPPFPVPPTSPNNSNSKSSLKSPKNHNVSAFNYEECEFCIRDGHQLQQNKSILWAADVPTPPPIDNPTTSNGQRKSYDPALYFEKQTKQPTIKVIPKLKIDPVLVGAGTKKKNSNTSLSPGENQHSKHSNNGQPQQRQLSPPEVSSPSPVGNSNNGNNSSSGTEYTEIPATGNGSSTTSAIVQPMFEKHHNHQQQHQSNRQTGITRHYSPSILDYRLFFINDAQKHGFFRKAVPTLPLALAVMFCIMNLVLPGSGTFMASMAIVFGSQTEYGPGCGCQAFFICFLSAILQFLTAIVVFGWVWSIMWGIVFIKNSLRYGQKRDIHTISLC